MTSSPDPRACPILPGRRPLLAAEGRARCCSNSTPNAVNTTLELALLAEDRAQTAVNLVLGRLEIDGDDP